MTDFGISFSQTENALLLVLIPVIFVLMLQSARVRRVANKALGLSADPRFEAPVNRPLKSFLYMVGLIFAGIAAVGPQWGQKAHPIKAQGLDICFAMDLSRSMMAEDLSPSRLEQAKNQLAIFLPRLGGDRAALVGFAGSSYVAAPLSVDHTALITFLEPMGPDVISDQATNLSAGVEACLGTLGLADIKDRNEILDDAAKLVVLVSDGEDTASDDTGAIAKAEKFGIPVFAMAVGTEKGAPIPLREDGKLTGYVKDPQTRQPVLSRLAIKGLKDIAEKTGGKVFYGSAGVEAWKDFENSIADFKRESRDAGTRLDKEERFQWPLAIAVLALLWDFVLTETKWRWSWKVLVFALAFFGAPRGQAAEPLPGGRWDFRDYELLRRNNQGVLDFGAKNHKQADERLRQALGEDADDPLVRYNWAANRLAGAVDPEDPKKIDEKALAEATSELVKLADDPRVRADASARRRVEFQLGKAAELKGEAPAALKHYYASLTLDPKSQKSEFTVPDTKLDEAAKNNIAHLLVAQQSNSQQQQQQSGEGGGEGKDDKKDQQGKDGENEKDKDGKKQNQQYGQGKQKAKFDNTDVSEGEARQILESVSGEEKEVIKRKARGEAKEQELQRKRDARERGEDTGRAQAW